MKKYIFTHEAKSDIEAINEYIYKQSPKSALSVVREIRRVCTLIGDMPNIGRLAEDIGADELRYLPAGKYSNYLIFYISTKNVVIVARIIHASRNIPTLMSHWHASK